MKKTTNKNSDFSYSIKDDGINEIITEKNNTVLMLREVAWGERPHALELRKWFIDSKSETPGKGVVFNTREAPDNLTDTLTKLGFGNTQNIINNIKDRDNFEESLINAIGTEKVIETKNKEKQSKEEFYDAKNLVV